MPTYRLQFGVCALQIRQAIPLSAILAFPPGKIIHYIATIYLRFNWGYNLPDAEECIVFLIDIHAVFSETFMTVTYETFTVTDGSIIDWLLWSFVCQNRILIDCRTHKASYYLYRLYLHDHNQEL